MPKTEPCKYLPQHQEGNEKEGGVSELLVVQIGVVLGSTLEQARAESLDFFFSDVGIALLPFTASSACCLFVSTRTELGIVPCHSPVPVPRNCSSPSLTRSHFQELRALHGWSGLHSPPCRRIKSKQQHRKPAGTGLRLG